MAGFRSKDRLYAHLRRFRCEWRNVLPTLALGTLCPVPIFRLARDDRNPTIFYTLIDCEAQLRLIIEKKIDRSAGRVLRNAARSNEFI